MTPTTKPEKRWDRAELERIDKADDLHIAPYRDDGKTTGTPTWIWNVVADDELYVRAYNGPDSRWYQAARTQRAGRIQAADKTHDVTFALIDGSMQERIDAAYRAKYKGSPYLADMLESRPRAATVRIHPK